MGLHRERNFVELAGSHFLRRVFLSAEEGSWQ